MEMSRLTPDGTAEPVSRETKFSGANADRETSIFPVQLTTCRIGNIIRLIHALAICVTIQHIRCGGGGGTMQCIFCYCHECVCVVFCHPIYSGRRTCGRTSRGHTGGRAHRISPPSFCGACLNFNREKDTAIPFPRRPSSISNLVSPRINRSHYLLSMIYFIFL